MSHAFPIVTALFAPGYEGKQRIVNAVVTLSSEGPSLCFRRVSDSWVCDDSRLGHLAPEFSQALAALRSATGAK